MWVNGVVRSLPRSWPTQKNEGFTKNNKKTTTSTGYRQRRLRLLRLRRGPVSFFDFLLKGKNLSIPAAAGSSPSMPLLVFWPRAGAFGAGAILELCAQLVVWVVWYEGLKKKSRTLQGEEPRVNPRWRPRERRYKIGRAHVWTSVT